MYLRSGATGVPHREPDPGSAATKRESTWLHTGVGAQILRDLGMLRIRTLVGRPTEYVGLGGYGLTVEEQVLIQPYL